MHVDHMLSAADMVHSASATCGVKPCAAGTWYDDQTLPQHQCLFPACDIACVLASNTILLVRCLLVRSGFSWLDDLNL